MLPLALLCLAVAFGLGAWLGAPYVPILRRDTKKLLDLAQLKPGQTLVDLGSGDGRLLRAAAARGIRCVGYEINPVLVVISRLVCWRYRHLVTVHLGNFWQVKLPPTDAVYVFLIDRYMYRLDQKLTAEISQPTKLISFIFRIPGRAPVYQSSNTYVYQYGQRSGMTPKP